MQEVARAIEPEAFPSLMDDLMVEVLREGFRQANADEGSIWLVDGTEEFLVAVFNTGPRAAEFVGTFKQPLKSGLICMVFANEQPFVENDVAGNRNQSKLLDSRLGCQTDALIAVPFYFLGSCRGVISCVQLMGNGASSRARGFSTTALKAVERSATTLSRLIDHALLSKTVGWLD